MTVDVWLSRVRGGERTVSEVRSCRDFGRTGIGRWSPFGAVSARCEGFCKVSFWL